LIQAVIGRLQLRVPDLVTEDFPDDPEEYRLNHPIGALLVRYHGSKYGKLLDSGIVAQERALAVEVTVVGRSLNGSVGVCGYLEAVRLALTGYQPDAFSKLSPLGDEFISQGGGEWRYAIDFATTTMAIEVEEPDTSVLATKITFTGGIR
jgi:hypothetical protein